MPTQDTICSAIRERRLVEIVYDGHSRTIEPHIVWIDAYDNYLVDGWQVAGHSTSPTGRPWKRFRISKIESITVSDKTFSGPRHTYDPNSERYEDIYCKL